ncbi:MAG: carbamoyltransferase HypF [Hyphomicrobiaceae bacterium]|nr:MAG: carbamoyltransferase HypF [Hyphomicrobiaceae bacterium]
MSDRGHHDECRQGAAFRVRGLVQGVGFRPTVWRLARAHGLAGEVLNDGEGVLIRAWGSADALDTFVAALGREPPPLARIDTIERHALTGAPATADFLIGDSRSGTVRTGIVPDAATCPACLADIADAGNRRYRYPFTNCTHCGPRLSIVRAIPYDRANTSMAVFAMCPDCSAEYADPADRRFHAQPTACPRCGPRVWLENADGAKLSLPAGLDAIAAAAAEIRAGRIVAVKGIGGFHLACDATCASAVSELRRRKRRHAKPFALMARDIAMIQAFARASALERDLLSSPAGPIVILAKADGADVLAAEVAPGQSSLGFMLPYTPLHTLLMQDMEAPIVLTSGNRSDEPQCITNEAARTRLAGIADLWLMHDRDIVNRLDDSVVRVAAGAARVLRRARGLAPEPIALAPGFADAPAVLAMGAELKSTFCLLRGGQTIVSQHAGDLEDAATHADYRAALALYRDLYRFSPEVVAVDAHPDYLSTQWGDTLARESGLAAERVQHHHAHVASCLAEHGLDIDAPPVLGIVLDGLGYGDGGALWGGEFLLADYLSSQRLAAFAPVPMVGGARATREPWRNAFAHLAQFVGWERLCGRYGDLPITRRLQSKPIATLQTMMARGVNAPPASSAGRLFDAVAAVLGISPETTSYEGQAAVELEALAATLPPEPGNGYAAEAIEGCPETLSWSPLWQCVLEDLRHRVEPARIAARFHAGLVSTIASTALRHCGRHRTGTVVLGGGVFQNRLLLEGVTHRLEASGLRVLSPRLVPANDGGISLGQAAVAAARALRGHGPGLDCAPPTSRDRAGHPKPG